VRVPIRRRFRKTTYGKGKRIEEQFSVDLQALKNRGLIADFRKSEWHGELDKQGIDAVAIRGDGVEVKLNVTTMNLKTISRHKRVNRELGRVGILIWPYDERLDGEVRLQNLFNVINEFQPTKPLA
jgi:hypothetical protein